MSSSASFPNATDTYEIPADRWTSFLAAFTQRNRGAHARLEVLDHEGGYVVETEDRPFDGAAADMKGSTRMLWLSFGSTAEDSLTHGVPEPVVLRVTAADSAHGEVMEIESQDGVRTILTLSRPEDFELPPAGA